MLITCRTALDRSPKVGPRHLDLFKLYQRVTAEGGYDKASDTKNNKLAWRRIASDFLPNNAAIVQLAFQVKTVYYKNLAWVLASPLRLE
jgi:chromatin structure-remodeling complex subunit RSC9